MVLCRAMGVLMGLKGGQSPRLKPVSSTTTVASCDDVPPDWSRVADRQIALEMSALGSLPGREQLETE